MDLTLGTVIKFTIYIAIISFGMNLFTQTDKNPDSAVIVSVVGVVAVGVGVYFLYNLFV